MKAVSNSNEVKGIVVRRTFKDFNFYKFRRKIIFIKTSYKFCNKHFWISMSTRNIYRNRNYRITFINLTAKKFEYHFVNFKIKTGNKTVAFENRNKFIRSEKAKFFIGTVPADKSFCTCNPVSFKSNLRLIHNKEFSAGKSLFHLALNKPFSCNFFLHLKGINRVSLHQVILNLTLGKRRFPDKILNTSSGSIEISSRQIESNSILKMNRRVFYCQAFVQALYKHIKGIHKFPDIFKRRNNVEVIGITTAAQRIARTTITEDFVTCLFKKIISSLTTKPLVYKLKARTVNFYNCKAVVFSFIQKNLSFFFELCTGPQFGERIIISFPEVCIVEEYC